MKIKEKAKILDYMLNHAKSLLNGNVKNISLYSAEDIILSRYVATKFIEAFKLAEMELSKVRKDE